MIRQPYHRILLLTSLLWGILVSPQLRSQILAFPGADGFGKFASGGRGGRVVEVTSLADTGPGTLRDAVGQEGPRTVVFRVSGTIELESDLVIDHGDLTIAGQTAPGDGICVRNYPTLLSADNVIIQHMRFRLGDERRQVADALCAMGCENVIIDHCSMSWGIDEVGSFYDNVNFTLQWSIISESLYNSYHFKGPHGFGGIWGGERATFHHNLLAHHSSRNPRFQGGRGLKTRTTELVDFRNNVVYNWGYQCAYGGELGKQNVVANYFQPGPASLHPQWFLEPYDSLGKWFVQDNLVIGSPQVSESNWQGVNSDHSLASIRVEHPFHFVVDSTQSPAESYHAVLCLAGATRPKRDTVDRRIVDETRNGWASFGDSSYARDHKHSASGKPLGIIDSQRSVGGWPELKTAPPLPDADHDGMPDAWERAHQLDPENPLDGSTILPSGYSNLEQYIHTLSKEG